MARTALIRSASVGVRPVVGSGVMSLTVKMPNCMSVSVAKLRVQLLLRDNTADPRRMPGPVCPLSPVRSEREKRRGTRARTATVGSRRCHSEPNYAGVDLTVWSRSVPGPRALALSESDSTGVLSDGGPAAGRQGDGAAMVAACERRGGRRAAAEPTTVVADPGDGGGNGRPNCAGDLDDLLGLRRSGLPHAARGYDRLQVDNYAAWAESELVDRAAPGRPLAQPVRRVLGRAGDLPPACWPRRRAAGRSSRSPSASRRCCGWPPTRPRRSPRPAREEAEQLRRRGAHRGRRPAAQGPRDQGAGGSPRPTSSGSRPVRSARRPRPTGSGRAGRPGDPAGRRRASGTGWTRRPPQQRQRADRAATAQLLRRPGAGRRPAPPARRGAAVAAPS